MIFSHGYARTVRRQQVERDEAQRQKDIISSERKQSASEATRRERERWEWFSKPQHEYESWLFEPDAEELRRPVRRMLLIPRPSAMFAAGPSFYREAAVVADFEAEPMAWEAPTGQLVRWFHWRPRGAEPIPIREYERRQMIERHDRLQSRYR